MSCWQPYGVESQHPDEFVDNLLDLDAAAVVSAAQRQRAQLKNPTIDVDRYLDILLRQGLVQTTKALASYRTICSGLLSLDTSIGGKSTDRGKYL